LKDNILAAVIVALGLTVAALMGGGLYQMQMVRDGEYMAVVRLNRLTGAGTISSTANHAGRPIDEENGLP
jgi:hypothetical protein